MQKEFLLIVMEKELLLIIKVNLLKKGGKRCIRERGKVKVRIATAILMLYNKRNIKPSKGYK